MYLCMYVGYICGYVCVYVGGCVCTPPPVHTPLHTYGYTFRCTSRYRAETWYRGILHLRFYFLLFAGFSCCYGVFECNAHSRTRQRWIATGSSDWSICTLVFLLPRWGVNGLRADVTGAQIWEKINIQIHYRRRAHQVWEHIFEVTLSKVKGHPGVKLL